MARAGSDNDIPDAVPHDGTVRCTLCSAAADGGLGHEWWDVASGLLCEACCDALQDGDPRRVLPLVLRSKGRLRLEEAIARCLECARMVRHVVKHAPGAEAVPPC